jgi:hypothetical protein
LRCVLRGLCRTTQPAYSTRKVSAPRISNSLRRSMACSRNNFNTSGNKFTSDSIVLVCARCTAVFRDPHGCSNRRLARATQSFRCCCCCCTDDPLTLGNDSTVAKQDGTVSCTKVSRADESSWISADACETTSLSTISFTRGSVLNRWDCLCVGIVRLLRTLRLRVERGLTAFW